MQVSYLGHSCFKIIGDDLTVLCDPFDPAKVGLPLQPQTADVVLVTHDHNDHNFIDIVEGDYDLLDGPGECEIDDSEFLGIPSYHDDQEGRIRGYNTIYRFDVDGIVICHLGDLGTRLFDEQLEKLKNIDVLMVPVGGYYTIDPATAIEVINQVNPKIVIPMHYQDGQTLKNIDKMYSLDDFLREMEVNPIKQDKLVITKKEIEEMTTTQEVVVLNY